MNNMSCIRFFQEPVKSISRQSLHLVDTPRGSWASFDLRNSVNDPMLPNLLERQPPEALDQMNQSKRDEHRLVIFTSDTL